MTTSIAKHKQRPLPDDKNPAHPSALRIRDLHPGRPVILFSSFFGIEFKGTVIDRPYVIDLPEYGRALCVMIRSDLLGCATPHRLTDMGVIPYATSGWDRRRFVIDARKQHLLPVPDINRIPSGLDGTEYGEDGDEDEDEMESNSIDALWWV